MILNQFGFSLTFRRNIKYKALAFLSSPIVFVLKEDTQRAWANDRGLWEEIAWGHPTRKAVNTLKLMNNWSHLFEEHRLCAILFLITLGCLISRFVKDGNTRQQLSFSVPELSFTQTGCWPDFNLESCY